MDGGVDVWALGCTLYAMAFGTCPFESPVEGIMKLAILDGKVSFPKDNTFRCCTFSNPFCKFIRFMLRVNIEERITIDDCIEKAELLLERCPKPESFFPVSNKHSKSLCIGYLFVWITFDHFINTHLSTVSLTDNRACKLS